MDLEDLLQEAEHKYHHNPLFRGLVYTIVDAVRVETEDEEIDGLVLEIAKRAVGVTLLITEQTNFGPEIHYGEEE